MATTRNKRRMRVAKENASAMQKNREITIAIEVRHLMLFYPIRCFSDIICYPDKIKYYIQKIKFHSIILPK